MDEITTTPANQQLGDYYRQCPGERYKISDAVCGQRRKNHYAKCPGCVWNEMASPTELATGQNEINHSHHAEALLMDKIFHPYEVRGIYPDQLNEDVAWKIGYATAQFLRMNLMGLEKADPRMNMIIVGRDMRVSSPVLSRALIDGILSSGTNCIDIGMVDTPQAYFAINHLGTCGGIQVTASHHAPAYNGFLFSGRYARPVGESTGLNEIKKIAQGLRKNPSPTMGRVESQDLSRPYKAHVLQFLKVARPLKVVVDCSNGMAAKCIASIFSDQANVHVVPINAETSGTFAHDPDPLVAANLRQLQEKVRTEIADFGVCFDGDADRCVVVDELGRTIRCDIITALLAREFLKKQPGSAIVYDLRSSRAMKEEILHAGGIPKRERVGQVFMKKSLADAKGIFGGELTGHYYFRDNFNSDSAAIAFAHLLSLFSRREEPVSQIVAPLLRYHASGELLFEVADKTAAIKRLADTYHDGTIDYLDGVTVEYDAWWFNARVSRSRQIVRVNIEASSPDLLARRVEEISALLAARRSEKSTVV